MTENGSKNRTGFFFAQKKDHAGYEHANHPK